MAMEMNIKDITETRDEGSIIATVKSRSKVTRNKTSGSMITGVLEDVTGTIDFVCWTETALKIDDVLKTGQTYKFTSVKVVVAKDVFSKSKHKFQIVLDKTTTLESVNCKPLVAPLDVIHIKDLYTKADNATCTVVVKVTSIPQAESLGNSGTKIVKVKIQDKTGVIQMSLIGDEIQKCNFSVGDVLLLENITLRVYGESLRVLLGNTGWRTVNPSDRDFSEILDGESENLVDLSPDKMVATKKTVDTLSITDGGDKKYSHLSKAQI